MKNIKVYINNKLLGSYDREKLELHTLPRRVTLEQLRNAKPEDFSYSHFEIIFDERSVYESKEVTDCFYETYAKKPNIVKKIFIRTK
jgi:hypothetical protein